MNTKINGQTKLELLDFLQREFETHKATVKNLIRNCQHEKERYFSNTDSCPCDDNTGILIDCERSIRKLSRNLEKIEKNLESIKLWHFEIVENEE